MSTWQSEMTQAEWESILLVGYRTFHFANVLPSANQEAVEERFQFSLAFEHYQACFIPLFDSPCAEDLV
jgi:hypothetical protein